MTGWAECTYYKVIQTEAWFQGVEEKIEAAEIGCLFEKFDSKKGEKIIAIAREGSWVKRTFFMRAENYTCLEA